MTRAALLGLLAPLALLAACGGKLPETRYYQLAADAPRTASATETGRGELVLVLEPLSADDAYQDERIVYRTGPYRLDYYQYHRWSASPGVMITGYLEDALDGLIGDRIGFEHARAEARANDGFEVHGV